MTIYEILTDIIPMTNALYNTLQSAKTEEIVRMKTIELFHKNIDHICVCDR